MDTLNGSDQDLTNPGIVNHICDAIHNDKIAGVMLATPCSSWSAARHGPLPGAPGSSNNSAPPPLRDRKSNIYGFAQLSPQDKRRVELGNRTMQSTSEVLQACLEKGVAFVMENPIQSMLWNAPEIRKVWCLSIKNQVLMPQLL